MTLKLFLPDEKPGPLSLSTDEHIVCDPDIFAHPIFRDGREAGVYVWMAAVSEPGTWKVALDLAEIEREFRLESGVATQLLGDLLAERMVFLDHEAEKRRRFASVIVNQNYVMPTNAAIRPPMPPRRTRRKTFSKQERAAILKKTGGKCFYCPTVLDAANFHVEHKRPRSRFGSDKQANLVPACPRCNTRKLTLTAEEFAMISQGGHS